MQPIGTVQLFNGHHVLLPPGTYHFGMTFKELEQIGLVKALQPFSIQAPGCLLFPLGPSINDLHWSLSVTSSLPSLPPTGRPRHSDSQNSRHCFRRSAMLFPFRFLPVITTGRFLSVQLGYLSRSAAFGICVMKKGRQRFSQPASPLA